MEQHRHYLIKSPDSFYWEGCIAFNHLRIGTEPTLKRESNNKFDPYAVAVYFGKYKLGISFPVTKTKTSANSLKWVTQTSLKCVLTASPKEEHPENQVGIIVYIKRKE